MLLAHLAFTLLILTILVECEGNQTGLHIKSALDTKQRSNIIDEAFLEQKDVLLDMLESKLREVKDKKKKANRLVNDNVERVHNMDEHKRDKCASLLQNVDVKVRINGISAVGDADVRLKYGNSGNGIVKVNSNGISNIGQANVEMGVGNSAVYIPGLSDLFVEHNVLNCGKTLGMFGSAPSQATPNDTRKYGENNETNSENITVLTNNETTTTVAPTTSNPETVTDNASVTVIPGNPSSMIITQGPLMNTFSTPANVNPMVNPVTDLPPQMIPGNGIVNAV